MPKNKPRVPSSPPRKRGMLAAAPERSTPRLNKQKVNPGFQDLNFKVSPEFHTVFKTIASVKGMPMKDLLEAAFEAWLEKFGDDHTRAITAILPRR